MTIAETSIQTYQEIINEGLVGEKQRIVFQCLATMPNSTDKEVSILTGLNINCVTGRRNELVDYGLVEANDKRCCKITGRTVYQWHLCDKFPTRKVLRKRRSNAKVTCTICQGTGKVKPRDLLYYME